MVKMARELALLLACDYNKPLHVSKQASKHVTHFLPPQHASLLHPFSNAEDKGVRRTRAWDAILHQFWAF
jgi:hypothetical protein